MPRRGVLDLLASTALLVGCGSASQEDGDGGSGGSGGAGEGGTGGDASSGGSGGLGGRGGAGGAGGQRLSCKDDGPPSACRLTEDNILGPFYKKGSPLADDLAGELPGQVLIIEGTVFGCDCETPLANALVDIWQADDDGAYDNAGFTLRGKVLTDTEGRYTVRTIKPGWYLNGDQYRPAHIHYKVSHPDGVALTTQLYFEGDPHIEIDPYVKESLVKAIVPDQSVGRVSFDIALG